MLRYKSVGTLNYCGHRNNTNEYYVGIQIHSDAVFFLISSVKASTFKQKKKKVPHNFYLLHSISHHATLLPVGIGALVQISYPGKRELKGDVPSCPFDGCDRFPFYSREVWRGTLAWR